MHLTRTVATVDLEIGNCAITRLRVPIERQRRAAVVIKAADARLNFGPRWIRMPARFDFAIVAILDEMLGHYSADKHCHTINECPQRLFSLAARRIKRNLAVPRPKVTVNYINPLINSSVWIGFSASHRIEPVDRCWQIKPWRFLAFRNQPPSPSAIICSTSLRGAPMSRTWSCPVNSSAPSTRKPGLAATKVQV